MNVRGTLGRTDLLRSFCNLAAQEISWFIILTVKFCVLIPQSNSPIAIIATPIRRLSLQIVAGPGIPNGSSTGLGLRAGQYCGMKLIVEANFHVCFLAETKGLLLRRALTQSSRAGHKIYSTSCFCLAPWQRNK
jgi:hypothetical protein